MVEFVVAFTFIAAFLLVWAAISLWEGIERSPMRLLQKRFSTIDQQKTSVRVFRDDAMSGFRLLNRWLTSAALARRFMRYLDQADIPQRVGVVLGAVLLLGFLGGRLVWTLTPSWYWSTLGLCAFGSLPLLYIRRRRRLRLELYAKQLPDGLDVLARSLRAGQSFLQGIQSVARDMPEPAGKEFRMTFEELRLGRSLREALQKHADRVENLDFNLISTALLIQREVGGNLTEVLENTSRTIRERYKLLGQVEAISAQNRLGAKIIGVLPIAIAGIVYMLNPNLIMVLFRDEMGKKLVIAAVTMQLMGYYVMKRIVTIKI